MTGPTPRPPAPKVAVFLPSLGGGGAERVMLRLAEGIAGRGCRVDLVLAVATGPYLAEVPPSVRLVDLGASRLLTSLPALVRYLKRERPNALLSGLYANGLALAARPLSGVPTRLVLTEHNTLTFESGHATALRVRLWPRLVKRLYPKADGIVAVSDGVADDLAASTGLPRRRIRTIYNPVITPELAEKARAPLDHPWFKPGEPPVVLAVGRLTGQKDFGTLIRAFARLRAGREARLLILGEGEKRAELEALVDELGLARDAALAGFVVDPYPFMARSSVFVLSSRWEGLPTVLIEALACGAPVVATDCPSGPREILGNGRFGPLVPIGDATALARAIAAVLDGAVARPPRECLEPFEIDTVVDSYIDELFHGLPDAA